MSAETSIRFFSLSNAPTLAVWLNGSTFRSTSRSCPEARLHGGALEKNLGLDVLARFARIPMLSAMSALHAPHQRDHEDIFGFAARYEIETHDAAKHFALVPWGDRMLAHRISHQFSSQLYGWRPRTASFKTAMF